MRGYHDSGGRCCRLLILPLGAQTDRIGKQFRAASKSIRVPKLCALFDITMAERQLAPPRPADLKTASGACDVLVQDLSRDSSVVV